MSASTFPTEMSTDGKPIIRYFVSYAHADAKLKVDLLNRLQMLFNLAKDYVFEPWQDNEILPGEHWSAEIQDAINHCHFGLLLVSHQFLNSRFITENELPYFCTRNPEQFTASHRAVPVGLRPIKFTDAIDLKGLEEVQVFKYQERFFSQLRGDTKKDEFTDTLFEAILDIVRKYVNSPSSTDQPLIPEYFDRDADFSKLIVETFRTVFKTIEKPLCTTALNAIFNLEEIAHSITLSDFIIEDFSRNQVILACQECVGRAWSEDPNIAQESENLGRKKILDDLEIIFHKLLSYSRFEIISAYFISDEYKRNLTCLLRKRYQTKLQKEFDEYTLLQESVMTLADIYVSPSFTISEFCINENSVASDYETNDIHLFLNLLFDDHDNKRSLVRRYHLHHNVSPSRLLIFGYPGQGKSSLCKRLSYDIIFGSIRSLRNVYILPLRCISVDEVKEFNSNPFVYIKKAISKQVYDDKAENIDTELRRSLVILDGLDELDVTANSLEGRYEQLLKNIFSIECNLSVIVTSRYINIDIEKIKTNIRPLILRLKAFDSSQQKEWLAKYQSFHPENKLTPDILDKINLYETQEQRLNSLKEREVALKAEQSKILELRGQSSRELNQELLRNEKILKSNLNFEEIKSEEKKAGSDYSNLNIEAISKILPSLIKQYPTLDLSTVREDVEMKTERRDRAVKQTQEAVDYLEDEFGKVESTLREKYFGAEITESLGTVEQDLKTVKEEVEQAEREIKGYSEYKRILQPIRELVSQPLLLYLINRLNIDLEHDRQIQSRSALYRELVNKLANDLFGQLMEQSSYDAAQPKILQRITQNDYRQFIRDLAFAIFAKGSEIISFSDAQNCIAGFNKKFNIFCDTNPNFLNSLLPTFYFKNVDYHDKNDGAIEFAHKSFQEYMTAELIWDKLFDFSKADYTDTEEKKMNLKKILSTRILTTDLLEFISDVAYTTPEDTGKVFSSLGKFFVDEILTHSFFYNSKVSDVCSCFYNVLSIMKSVDRYEQFPIELTNSQKIAVFNKMLQLFLTEHSDRKIDVSCQLLQRSDLTISTTNVMFCDNPVKQEDYFQSQSFRDFYL